MIKKHLSKGLVSSALIATIMTGSVPLSHLNEIKTAYAAPITSKSTTSIGASYLAILSSYERRMDEATQNIESDNPFGYPGMGTKLGYLQMYRGVLVHLNHLVQNSSEETIGIQKETIKQLMKKSNAMARDLWSDGGKTNPNDSTKVMADDTRFRSLINNVSFDKYNRFEVQVKEVDKDLGVEEAVSIIGYVGDKGEVIPGLNTYLHVFNNYYYPATLGSPYTQNGRYIGGVFFTQDSLIRQSINYIAKKVTADNSNPDRDTLSEMEVAERYTQTFQLYEDGISLVTRMEAELKQFNLSQKYPITKPSINSSFIKVYNKYREGTAINSSIVDIETFMKNNGVNDKKDLQKLINIGDKDKLITSQYLYMLSATAIYEPLKDSVGNDDYQDLLSQVSTELPKIYTDFGYKRKPLLKVKSNNYKAIISGDSKNFTTDFVTLGDIRKSVLNGEKSAYVVAMGEYTSSGDIKSDLDGKAKSDQDQDDYNVSPDDNNNGTGDPNDPNSGSGTTPPSDPTQNQTTPDPNNTPNPNTAPADPSGTAPVASSTINRFFSNLSSKIRTKTQDLLAPMYASVGSFMKPKEAIAASKINMEEDKSTHYKIFGSYVNKQTELAKERARALKYDPTSQAKYAIPANGYVSSYFGFRDVSNGTTMHGGIDIANGGQSTPVYAITNGTVNLVNKDISSSAGRYVTIEHEGENVVSRYLHLKSINVTNGQKVKKGDVIGQTGGSGNGSESGYPVHLHLDYLVDGKAVDPYFITIGEDVPAQFGVKRNGDPNDSAANGTNTNGFVQQEDDQDTDIVSEFLDANEKERYSNIIFTSGMWDDFTMTDISGVDNKYRSYNLLGGMLYNILESSTLTKELLDAPVYVDFLGNIILQDNTILVPAVANYALYGITKEDDNGQIEVGQGVVHPLVNRAFLMSYPKLANPKDPSSMLVSGDEKKFMLKSSGIYDEYVNGSTWTFAKPKELSLTRKLDSSLKSVLGSVQSMFDENKEKASKVDRKTFSVAKVSEESTPADQGSVDNATARKIFSAIPETKFVSISNNMISFDGKTFALSNVASPELNRFLTEVNYQFFSTNGKDSTHTLKNGISPAFIIKNAIIPSYKGFEDTAGYLKAFIEQTTNRPREISIFVETIGGAVSNLYDNIKGVTGIIGFQDIYHNKLLGSIAMFGFDYTVVLLLILFVIFILKYAKEQYNLAVSIGFSIISCFVLYFAILIFPRYIPDLYNLASNNFAHDISMNAILFNTEKDYYKGQDVFETYSNDQKKSEMDYSLPLYKLSEDSFSFVRTIYDISKLDANKPIKLDGKEIYIMGDQIRVNASDIFSSIQITGDYGSKGVYQMKIDTMGENTFNYYMPFRMMAEGLTDRINTYASVTDPERRSYKYGDLIKDAFMANSFTSSGVFIGYSQKDKAYEEKVRRAFEKESKYGDIYPLVDFMGIGDSLTQIDATDSDGTKDKKSLWYKNFDELRKKDPDIAMLKIKTINDQTRRFIYDNRDALRNVSDENFIKICALYASMEFNAKFGDWGYNLYPMFANYGDLNIEDLFQVLIPSKSDIFHRNTIDIVDYTMQKTNIAGITLLGLNTVLTPLNAVIMTYFYSVIYILFIVFLILKLIKKEHTSPIMKSFIRLSFILLAIYYINVLFYYFIWHISSTMVKLVLMFGFNLILLDTMISLAFSIRDNIFDLGYGSIYSRQMNKIDRRLSKIQKLMNTGHLVNNYKNRRNNKDYNANNYDRYNYDNLNRYGADGLNYDNYSSPPMYSSNIKPYSSGSKNKSDNSMNLPSSEIDNVSKHINTEPHSYSKNSDGSYNLSFENDKDLERIAKEYNESPTQIQTRNKK